MMKKFISGLFIMVLLLSGYAHGEEDKLSLEVCQEGAESDGLSSDAAKEYIAKCVKYIAEDEQREQMEVKQGS